LPFNKNQQINSESDFDELISEVKEYTPEMLKSVVGELHQNQSNYMKSGYFPLQLLTLTAYLSKNGRNFD